MTAMNEKLVQKSESAQEDIKLEHIAISDLHPDPKQPRKFLDGDDAITGLKNNILANRSVFTPIQYRIGVDGKKYIVMGERRWRAAKEAGLTDIPAIKFDDSVDYRIAAYMDNQDRKKLLPMEEALYLKQLLAELNIEQRELADKLNISEARLSEKLKIASLDKDIQTAALRSAKWTSQKLLELSKVKGVDRDFLFKRYSDDYTIGGPTSQYSEKQIKGWKKSALTARNKIKNEIDSSLMPDMAEKYTDKIDAIYQDLETVFSEMLAELDKQNSSSL